MAIPINPALPKAFVAGLLLLGLSGACSSPEQSNTNEQQPVALGLGCSSSAGCLSGVCITETRAGSGVSWTAGTCSQVCSAASACPTASACVAFEDGSTLCLGSCSKVEDCRPGYVCSSGVGACLPDCRLGFSCGTSLACDSASGACVLGTGAIGAPCAGNFDCASALCTPAQSTSAGTAWSGGYCTALCSTATACPSAAVCIDYADGSACAASCAASTDCRAGYVCSPGVGACLPDCRQGWSCGSELACDPTTGACA